MTSVAYAMGGMGQAAGGAKGGDFSFIILMIAMFAIFYFLLIRPQQKKQKEHKAMLENIQHGDSVITVGGLHGKVAALTDDVVTLELTDKIRVKVSRSHIGSVSQKAEQ